MDIEVNPFNSIQCYCYKTISVCGNIPQQCNCKGWAILLEAAQTGTHRDHKFECGHAFDDTCCCRVHNTIELSMLLSNKKKRSAQHHWTLDASIRKHYSVQSKIIAHTTTTTTNQWPHLCSWISNQYTCNLQERSFIANKILQKWSPSSE